MNRKCVIIGGGIVGLCTAYYLIKEGHEVIVVDKGTDAEGASYVNAGYITPSHVIPLSSPGIITKGLKWMFNSRSPFYVKPRLESNFLSWSWAFKKSATEAKVKKAIPVIKEINFLSRDLYESMRAGGDFDFNYHRNGIFMCYKTEEAEKHETYAADLAIKEGMDVRHCTLEEMKKMQPGVDYNLKGSFFYDCDGHMTPDDFMQQITTYLEKSGVTILRGKEVVDFNQSGNKVTKVELLGEVIDCDEVVICSGVWTSGLVNKLGSKMLMEAGKGYSFNTYTSTNMTIPCILVDSKCAVTPMNGFTRFAGTMELSGINKIIRKERVDAIADAANSYFNHLKITEEEKSKARSGLRPCTPDGLPYIGRLGNWKNVTVAAGHAMMGWSLAPATGKFVSEIISEQPLSMDISPFSPERRFV
ncbi:NAD(P)/FAD-dependent oxidoreductase [Aegicerativicinus sediminis]|uniref:NAD(P)/FAD-dependent oxidoreductase n=1 Tax=Aegicerativicinus sediminis TaxID=2893202 RepID=UPI001E649D3B|nr:FAD-dependent oxidoreductase [Aegicerativicinus sediminis]